MPAFFSQNGPFPTQAYEESASIGDASRSSAAAPTRPVTGRGEGSRVGGEDEVDSLFDQLHPLRQDSTR